VLTIAGETAEAVRQADLASGVATGGSAALLAMYRALIHHRRGRLDEALEAYGDALPRLRLAGDVYTQAQLLSNRGILHAYRGNFSAAEVDLAEAEGHFARLGQRLRAAEVRHNLGFVAARRGDVPHALLRFDQAAADFRALEVSRPTALLDRCETLLGVRLVTEARLVGAKAAAELEASGAEADLAEARLLLSQAALLDGDHAEAGRLASLARGALVRQERPGWAAMARYAALRATWAAEEGTATEATMAEAEATVDDLVAARWTVPAMDACLVAARIALELGRLDDATDHLQRTAKARFRGPADLRARAWHAEALLRRSRGDPPGADAALRAGLRVLSLNRATLGATELRVHAAARATDLGRLGMRMALESGRARRVLTWAERVRAGWAAMARPLLPPDDDELAGQRADLRHVVFQLEEAAFTGQDPSRLLRRQEVLEAQIRHTARHAAGTESAQDRSPPTAAEIGAALGPRALVELLECDGDLHAVTVVDGEAHLHGLGPVAAAADPTDRLRWALSRLAQSNRSVASREAAVALAVQAAAALDDLLLRPLRRRLGDRPLVLVPTGPLHAVPWSALPSCRGRPVSVAPSAAAWVRVAGDDGDQGDGVDPMVLVAGPGLAQAVAEVEEVARVHRPAATLTGAAATTTGFLEKVDGAGLVHVVAHGRFRSDNALFSSLRMVDGPLTVYDLERLRAAPRRIVLSACEAGLSSAHPGEELMGLTSSLFSLGSRTLVASVVPVADDTTLPLMVELHRRLATGTSSADALAGAQQAAGEGEPALCTAGFVCFGAG
jgi:tetratricopeptide (TPR) repeat protein